MHRTTIASTRNSLGFNKHFDSTAIESNLNDTTDAVSNSAKLHSDDITYLYSDRIHHEISPVVVDDIFSYISSAPSEICRVDGKTAPPRRNRNTRFHGNTQRDYTMDVTPEIPTTAARVISDVVDDHIFETNQLQVDVVNRDDDCAVKASQQWDVSSVPLIQSESAATLRVQSIEQMTSHLQRINLSKDDCRTECDQHNRDINSKRRMAQDHSFLCHNKLDDATARDMNDVSRSNENEPKNSAAAISYRGCVGSSKLS